MKKLLTDDQLMGHWFVFSLPEENIREMNRKEYYAVMSYLRRCRRIVADRIELMLMSLHKMPEVKWFQLNADHSYKK